MVHASHMATATIARSDLWPVGTSVGIYPAASKVPGQPPGSPAIASASVDAAGLLTITNAGVLAGTRYVCYAAINGDHRYAFVMSTADTFDRGLAVGTGDTATGSANLANVSASSGAFAAGQRINGPGIPSGTRLISGSGNAWVMSTKATANGSGVALVADGARVGAANLGSTVVPSRISTPWSAQLIQRRVTAGTS